MTREAPASLLPSLEAVDFVCPRCRGELATDGDAFRCSPCNRRYPLTGGIPDFRVLRDPYLSVEEDLARSRRILDVLDRLPFPDLLAHYWSLSEETPPPLRERFVATAMRGEERARRTLAALSPAERGRLRSVLEVGTGTGNLLAAADGVVPRIVGTDVAMRWLHVARRRLRDAARPEPALACCGGEFLPFRDGSFDAVVSVATLEFVPDAKAFLSECSRVVAPGGILLLSAVNRFTIGREPHVALWGVGFLPRAWQAGYVRRRQGASFENVHLRSRGELRRLAAACSLEADFFLPDLGDEEARRLSSGARLALRVYQLAKRFAAGRALLRQFGPEWVVVLRKDGPGLSNR
ncbi:MAG: methyltransferase domain-containing protein [Acidobacteria bacterium]|nr:methyltransferase domain-containing protein [Acidobacteriota bacterium]MCA1610971.1 methyltransferase domain-containing protein [Acidobacteriota bacterium]